jgi:hypothetical protein
MIQKLLKLAVAAMIVGKYLRTIMIEEPRE